jgi:prevent-host-death family protein
MAKPRTRHVNVHDAKTNFSKLLKLVERGEEVIIDRAGHPIARIIRLAAEPSDRVPGSAKGAITVGDNFDAPVPDLERSLEQ